MPERGLDFAEEARRFEPSIQDVASIAAMEASIDLLEELGTAAIEERVLGMGAAVTAALESRGYGVISSRQDGERSGIISLAEEGTDAAAIQRRLRERDVACVVRGGRVRLAVHLYNDAGDLDRLLACLPERDDAGVTRSSR